MEPIPLVVAAVAIVAVLIAVRREVVSTTVFEYERGLEFTRGRLIRVLESGLYRRLRAFTQIRKIDLRPTQLAVSGQEVLSSDGVAVKASVAASYRVADPTKALLSNENYAQALYVELQQALRAAVAGSDIESLLANRATLGPQIKDQCAPAAERLGIALEGVAVRDLTLPGELKRIFAQVVRARQEGLAALERARGETAALRNLANAAHLVQRNPHLMQLRLLQVLGQQGGNTIVVGMPAGATPLPLRADATPPPIESGDASPEP